jgi:hypothetical protein
MMGASSPALIQPSPAGLPRATMCRDNSAAQPWSEGAEVGRDVETPVDLFRLVDLVGSIFKK